MARGSADVEQSCPVNVQLQADAGASAPAGRVRARFGIAAACLTGAALLLALLASASTATGASKRTSVIGLRIGSSSLGSTPVHRKTTSTMSTEEEEEDQEKEENEEEEEEEEDFDKLQSMIAENDEKIPALEGQVAQAIKDGEYGRAGALAVKIGMLQDQNARNQELWELVQETKKALDVGAFSHSDALLRDIISDKCTALTKTKISRMQIELKGAIDADEYDKADQLMDVLQPLEANCKSYPDAVGAIKEAHYGQQENATAEALQASNKTGANSTTAD